MTMATTTRFSLLFLLLWMSFVPLLHAQGADTGLLCWDQVFMQREEFDEIRTGVTMAVLLRVVGDCPLEREVLLLQEPERVVATVRKPVKKPVTDQAEITMQKRPKQEPCSSVKMTEWQTTSAEVPELLSLVGELREIRMAPAFEPAITVHAVHYTLWISSLINRSYFHFQGPPFRASSRSGQNLHVLDVWAQNVLRALNAACPLEEF